MTTYSLVLSPYKKQSFSVELSESNQSQDTMQKMIEHSTDNKKIFSDLSYTFNLRFTNIVAVRNVYVYINDVYEPSTYNEGQIRFPAKKSDDRRIFIDCYGFVKLTLVLYMNDESELTLNSEYLPVLVRRSKLNEAVKAMVNYVYNHQDQLIINGEPKPRNMGGLKNSNYRNLSSQIVLIEKIAKIYEINYGYFKANSRFRIEKATTIDYLEHLQQISPATLNYIASHPEQLKQVNSTAGIQIGNRVYQPQKTLLLQNIHSYNIYENRVVLGFLQQIIDSIITLQNQCKLLLKQIPHNEDYSAEYVYSSFFMFIETKKTLNDGIQKLSSLHEKCTQLWSMYSNTFMITSERLVTCPHPTAIFMSVPQYNKVFTYIYQWFNYGIYNLSKEHFILSFIKISSLYENYLLVKMISYFRDRGYILYESKRCLYPVSRKSKYKNTNCFNTFILTSNQDQITLYYQPVIFDTDQSTLNGISLYRNNSIPTNIGDNKNYKGGHYYVPDFLIKISTKSKTKYLIIDAKFSDFDTVTKHYIKELVFKYLFSISPIRNEDSVIGMCIIYAKCTESDQLQSIYDKQLYGNVISPFAETLPLMESISSDDQYNKLDTLFLKIID